MKKMTVITLAVALMTSGCASWDGMSNTSKGSIIGAVGGAVVGTTLGHGSRGALIGAIGGGLAGAGVGHYMDSQARDLQKVLAAEVNKGFINIEKTPYDSIKVTMTANTSFNTNSATLKPGFYTTLNKIAQVVNKYGKTTLAITGYTDSTGPHSINQPLSQQRAVAVANYLLSKQVIPARISTSGLGAANPIASNATEAGRMLNRRVEILITPVTE